MSKVRTLVDVLKIERIGEHRFIGRSHDVGRRSIYGGLVISQALHAGMLSVPERLPHSLHAYFLQPGDIGQPVVYAVQPVYQGRSFTACRIEALQQDQVILMAMLSFQKAEEGLDYQPHMPETAAPETLDDGRDTLRRYLAGLPDDAPEKRNANAQGGLFELRHTNPGGFLAIEAPRTENRFWFRASALPDNLVLHYCALAYASDYGPMATSLLPHGKTPVSPDIRMASIDHALWFHREARADEWLLFDLEATSSQGARALSTGKIFARDGRLIASVAQEGLLRTISKKDG